MTVSFTSRLTLAVWLGLILIAAPRTSAAGARQASRVKRPLLAPLFDTNRRFKLDKSVKLKFRARNQAGAPVAPEEISFSLNYHAPGGQQVALPARPTMKGVFEVQFRPEHPGKYTVSASIRGVPPGSIIPVRLGVIGVEPGLVEEPPQADLQFAKHRNKKSAR